MSNWQAGAYRQIFQYSSFRSFWIGYSFSILGDTMTRVALTWFVYETTNSAQALGLLTLFYTGPVILGGLVAGWLLDRFNRQQVMLVDSLLRAIVVLLIPVLHAWGHLALWHIYLVAAIYGLLMMIPLAGGPSLVPALIPKQHLTTANALETLSFTLGGVVGPPLAGFLIAWIGAPNVVVLDAISYLTFALLLTHVKTLVDAGETARPAQVQSYGLQDAFRLLRRNKILLSTTLMFMTYNLGFGALFVWLPIYSDRVLGGGPQLYGALLGSIAIGEVLSSFLAGSMILPFSLGVLICLTQFMAGLSLTLLLWSKHITWALTGLGLFGFFSAPLTIWAQTLRMEVIPEPLRGRTFALLRMLMQGANPVGGLLAGLLLPVLSISIMMGVSTVLVGAPGLFGYRVKALRLGKERTGYAE